MKFILKVNPLLLKDNTLGIGDLLDAIREEKKELSFSTGFLDHTKNTVEIYSGNEFMEFIENYFRTQIAKQAIVIEIAGSGHTSAHKPFLNVHGYMVCGCGWIETFEQRKDREIKEQVGNMQVIKMEL